MRVLLLPGFGASRRNFQAYFNNFEDFEVVDFHECRTIEEHITQIRIKIKEKEEKVCLIGVSWGGLLALIYADKHPDQIQSMLIAGTDKKLQFPKSLNTIMRLPFPLFIIIIGLYVLSYPVVRIIDTIGYRQKYGGLKVLNRYGWKNTHNIYNKLLLPTSFDGKIHHKTILLNLKSDFLVSERELNILKDESGAWVEIKYLELNDQTHIHMSHELDEHIIREAKIAFP